MASGKFHPLHEVGLIETASAPAPGDDPVVKRLEADEVSNGRSRDPGSAWKRDPTAALGQACPGSEQEGRARVAQCPHERRSGAAWEVPVCPPGQAGVALRRGV
jgi:hypothetical protein